MSPSWKFITPPWLCCRLDPTQQGNDKCCATEFVYQPGSEKSPISLWIKEKSPTKLCRYLPFNKTNELQFFDVRTARSTIFLHHNHFCGVDSTLQNSSNQSRNPFVNSISSFSKHSNIYWHALKIDPAAYIGNLGPVTKLLLPTLKRNVDSSVMSCRLNANSLTQKASSLTPMNIDAAACQNF